jgi:8-oxoguanine deaminase
MSCASRVPAIRWRPLVLCGAHAADRVMIKGEWSVVDGAPLGVDVARLRAQHGKAAKRFVE